jgi:nucleoside-diphosphate-sugar epimerase
MGSIPNHARILVTGLSGVVGGLVGTELAKRYEVRGLNRRRVIGFENFQADIADPDAIRPAFEGVHIVIHMAAYATFEGEFDQYIASNVIGTYNVYEAAREAGVKRVIFASAGASVYNYVKEEPYAALAEARWDDVVSPRPALTHLAPYRPNGVYGATKAWGEVLGRTYSDLHGLSVLCVRVGHVPHPPQDEYQLNAYQSAIYCSHRDIVQFFVKCVEAPDSLRYDIFFACSNNRGLFRDIEHARKVLGYVPEDGIRDWPLTAPTA